MLPASPIVTVSPFTSTARACGTHPLRPAYEKADYARVCDTVNACFSKGLGAPVGSALAGRSAFIERARRFKQMYGGGFRQAGVIAAGALYALEHHRADLPDDHKRAATLAAGLSCP